MHLIQVLGVGMPTHAYDAAAKLVFKKNYLWVCKARLSWDQTECWRLTRLSLPLNSATSIARLEPPEAWPRRRFWQIVHPDKCQEPRTAEAFRVVDDAYKAYLAAA